MKAGGGWAVNEQYVVYILRCADGSLYTGYTRDLQTRLKQHEQGRGAKYTRGRAPLSLVYEERFSSQSAAMSREARIKQMNREQKLALIDRKAANKPGSTASVHEN